MKQDMEYIPRGCLAYDGARLALAVRLAGLSFREALGSFGHWMARGLS